MSIHMDHETVVRKCVSSIFFSHVFPLHDVACLVWIQCFRSAVVDVWPGGLGILSYLFFEVCARPPEMAIT